MKQLIALALGGILAAPAGADDWDYRGRDFGRQIEQSIRAQSERLFGTRGTLAESSRASLTALLADANPASLIKLAPGLRARVVSAATNLGANIDMMALWPNDRTPTHLIACNEQGPTSVGLQRIRLADGLVETIVKSGLTACDPVEKTAWGTIVFAEENGANGRVFELIDPLNTTDVVIAANGIASGGTNPNNIAIRNAVGRLSFEGISIYPNGVTYYGDEARPGSGNPGGAYFKFIPTVPYFGDAPITSLDQSPLAGGRVFGLRIGKRSGNTDFGPGNQLGQGVWVEVVEGLAVGSATVTRNNLRAAAPLLKLTANYRPEDHDIDRGALASGFVRFCGANTGDDGDTFNYGETFCISDGTLDEALTVATTTQTVAGVTYTLNNGPATSTPEYQALVTHFEDFAMPDNVAYQPGRGNWIVHEDGEGPNFGRNNDIWSCVDDGQDKDGLADACGRIAALNDLTAESTGGVFDATGRRFFVSIQHNITGHGVILEITGWKFEDDVRD